MPISRRDPDVPLLSVLPIKCVLLADLSVPPAISEIGDTPPDIPVNHFMDIVQPLPPEAASSCPAPSAAVPEAPPAPKVIDIRSEVPHDPSVVVYRPLGASVSLPVPTRFRSVPIPA